MLFSVLLAASLLTLNEGGAALTLDSETAVIDPGRSVFVTVTVTAPEAANVRAPDLRELAVGFALAEDFAEEPVRDADGRLIQTVNWRLVPEPCAPVYKLRPFAFAGQVAGPVYFENPPPREAAPGPMEVEPKKDLPPWSWKLAGEVALALVALGLMGWALAFAVRYLARRVREHRMSPIERAWAELGRLLEKGLPGRGRYKDFYVELTMVVRRYIQRRYGVRAPHLTTEEFLREIGAGNSELSPMAQAKAARLREFLESADMVKFAGVEATPEMADAATASARDYLERDARAGDAE